MDILNTLQRFYHHNKTRIWTGIGVGAVVATVITSFTEAPKICKILDQAKEDLEITDPDDKETIRQIMGETIIGVAPKALAIIFPAALACFSIIKVDHTHAANYAAAVSLLNTTQQQLKDWRDVTHEKLGDKKYEELTSDVATRQLQRAPEEALDNRNYPGGNYYIYDPQTHAKWRINDAWEETKDAELELISRLCQYGRDFCTRAELYKLLGGPELEENEDVGWNAGYEEQKPDIRVSIGSDNHGNPCWVLDYTVYLERMPGGRTYSR